MSNTLPDYHKVTANKQIPASEGDPCSYCAWLCCGGAELVTLLIWTFLLSFPDTRIMISSQAHACEGWPARERIHQTASWHRRPGLCSRNTTSPWRRLKGLHLLKKKKLQKEPGLYLCFKAGNAGTSPLRLEQNACLTIVFKLTFLFLTQYSLNFFYSIVRRGKSKNAVLFTYYFHHVVYIHTHTT